MHKTVFPIFMLTIAAMLLLVLLGVMLRDREVSFLVLGFIGLAAVYVYAEYRKRAIDLVDEVWDEGDSLLIKNKGEELRVKISNISKLKYGGLGNSHFVILTLREPCELGVQVRFVPPRKLLQFFKNPLIVDLAIRVKNANGVIET